MLHIIYVRIVCMIHIICLPTLYSQVTRTENNKNREYTSQRGSLPIRGLLLNISTHESCITPQMFRCFDVTMLPNCSVVCASFPPQYPGLLSLLLLLSTSFILIPSVSSISSISSTLGWLTSMHIHRVRYLYKLLLSIYTSRLYPDLTQWGNHPNQKESTDAL